MFYYLENTNYGHNKFYMISAYTFINKVTGKNNKIYVSLQYGKIGTIGQAKHSEFKRIGEAFNFAEEKVKEKLNKGYVIIKIKKLRLIADIPKANEILIG